MKPEQITEARDELEDLTGKLKSLAEHRFALSLCLGALSAVKAQVSNKRKPQIDGAIRQARRVLGVAA